jgi:hypothetical protein
MAVALPRFVFTAGEQLFFHDKQFKVTLVSGR